MVDDSPRGLDAARRLSRWLEARLPGLNPDGSVDRTASVDGSRCERSVDANVAVEDVVTVREYHPAVLRAEIPGFDQLPPAEKLAAIDDLDLQPVREHSTGNTTCIGLHERAAAHLNDTKPSVPAVAQLAVGTSNTSPAVTDTSLGNEVASVDITAFDDEGSTLTTRTFINSRTANGHTLREVGLYAGDKLCNHSLLAAPIEKDNSSEATITAQLSFTDQ